MATARSHRLNLFDYLVDVLDRLAHPMAQDQLVELLPHRWKPRNGNPDAE